VEDGGCAYPEFTQLSIWPDYFTAERFDNYPVAFISWPEAQNYCRWRGGYLPTEAQWEKAARYNPETGEETSLFPWGDLAPDLLYANFGNNLGQKPEEANENPDGASPIGALNMAGNMIEWVYDWYDPNYYGISPQDNPLGPETGVEKILRGGYWDSSGRELTVTWRYGIGPGYKEDWIGFRCAYTPPPGVDPTLGYGEQPTVPAP
jgi:formylglycine-generating enzyme required for sulfatase activity